MTTINDNAKTEKSNAAPKTKVQAKKNSNKAPKKTSTKNKKAMTAAEWARTLGKNPKVARAKLRRAKLAFKDKAIAEGSEAYKIIASINAAA